MDNVMAQTPPEHEIVTTWRVSCNGGGGALGHPLVYHSVSHERGFVECNYCDKLFVHADHAARVLADFGIDA